MAGNFASPNPNVPPVNQPIADLSALTAVAQQLRQGVMSLGGQLGGPMDRAVTLNDLVTLGLITKDGVKT
jgi:hypothetical protein